MSIARLLEGGLDRIVELAKANQLEHRFLWVALKGAWKYARAVAIGDIASPIEEIHRAAICARCSAHDVVETSKAGVCAGYCGKTETHGANSTCGCLVTMTINGQIEAAGKTKVASECCPRDKWNAAPRWNE
jgi:hypothetical protein